MTPFVPPQKRAAWQALQTLSDNANTVTAEGLEMNSATHVIKLLSKVRGTYDPGSSPRNKARR